MWSNNIIIVEAERYPLANFSLYFFISMVLLRIPTAVEPMIGIGGFKYQASDG